MDFPFPDCAASEGCHSPVILAQTGAGDGPVVGGGPLSLIRSRMGPDNRLFFGADEKTVPRTGLAAQPAELRNLAVAFWAFKCRGTLKLKQIGERGKLKQIGRRAYLSERAGGVLSNHLLTTLHEASCWKSNRGAQDGGRAEERPLHIEVCRSMATGAGITARGGYLLRHVVCCGLLNQGNHGKKTPGGWADRKKMCKTGANSGEKDGNGEACGVFMPGQTGLEASAFSN